MELTAKQDQFNAAMERFNSGRSYHNFNHAVSLVNITLQIFLLFRVWPHAIGPAWQMVAVAAAYLATDFLNGLIHMYMDNNDRYDSIAGPLIANFHLHHKVPRYTTNSLPRIYFNESGSKIWLIGFLAMAHFLVNADSQHPVVLYVLAYTGILSSIAEVSHYLCHSSTSPAVKVLAALGLLLSKKHHSGHHLQDNTNYAFLNGITDPLLNWIAAQCCRGYKQTTDLHYARYYGLDDDSR